MPIRDAVHADLDAIEAIYRHYVETSTCTIQEEPGTLALRAELVTRARSAGHHSILALITAEQPASLRLHARHGFTQVALLREVGWKLVEANGKRVHVVGAPNPAVGPPRRGSGPPAPG